MDLDFSPIVPWILQASTIFLLGMLGFILLLGLGECHVSKSYPMDYDGAGGGSSGCLLGCAIPIVILILLLLSYLGHIGQ